jgi:hypothetical protein
LERSAPSSCLAYQNPLAGKLPPISAQSSLFLCQRAGAQSLIKISCKPSPASEQGAKLGPSGEIEKIVTNFTRKT